MGITLVIVGGLVVMTAVASAFSYLTEKRKRSSPEVEKRLAEIESRLGILEDRAGDRDERLDQISHDLSFVNRLIEKNPKAE